MAYQMVLDGEYPETGLPVYKVYDADEYNDPSVIRPRAIGEVWGVGVKGAAAGFVPTGVRFQLSGTGDLSASPLFPAGAYAKAARAMIALHDGTAA